MLNRGGVPAAVAGVTEGDDYLALKPTISISFLNHVLFPGVADYHQHFRLLESLRDVPLTDDIEFHIVELPKFTESLAELTSSIRYLALLFTT